MEAKTSLQSIKEKLAKKRMFVQDSEFDVQPKRYLTLDAGEMASAQTSLQLLKKRITQKNQPSPYPPGEEEEQTIYEDSKLTHQPNSNYQNPNFRKVFIPKGLETFEYDPNWQPKQKVVIPSYESSRKSSVTDSSSNYQFGKGVLDKLNKKNRKETDDYGSSLAESEDDGLNDRESHKRESISLPQTSSRQEPAKLILPQISGIKQKALLKKPIKPPQTMNIQEEEHEEEPSIQEEKPKIPQPRARASEPKFQSQQSIKQRKPSIKNAKQGSRVQSQGQKETKTNWRKKSEQFRNAMRASKAGSMLEVDLVDDRKECPHCKRKFNDQAAAKHIPLCPKARKRY